MAWLGVTSWSVVGYGRVGGFDAAWIVENWSGGSLVLLCAVPRIITTVVKLSKLKHAEAPHGDGFSCFFLFLLASLLLSSSTYGRVYPQRLSRQVAVTGVALPPPEYVPSFDRASGPVFLLLVDVHRIPATRAIARFATEKYPKSALCNTPAGVRAPFRPLAGMIAYRRTVVDPAWPSKCTHAQSRRSCILIFPPAGRRVPDVDLFGIIGMRRSIVIQLRPCKT